MMPSIDESAYLISARPAEMDQLWAKGWRHFGPAFFRYSHTLSGTELRHVMPLRLDLNQFSLSKSQRRVRRKIADLRLQIAPTVIDVEREDLFDLHKQRFTENVPESRGMFHRPFANRITCAHLEVALLDGSQLIAASYLDLGARSVSSVYGYFHPDHAWRSPGIATMLLEIEYAQQHGYRYYYPGYAFREPSHYDYKKQFTALETYDWSGRWIPLQ
jgi:arginine-tRNA-protein transferase